MTSSQLPSADLIADLRARTSSLHAQLDAALNFRPGEVTRERYVGLLRGTLSALVGLAPALTDWLGEGAWPRRLECLQSDLAQLAAAPVADAAAIPLPATLAEAYGCAYVVEGSTLGGLVLAPIIERELALPPGLATSYLRLWGHETAAHWRAFVGRLAEFGKSVGPAEHEEACAMACATFHGYTRALQQHGAFAP